MTSTVKHTIAVVLELLAIAILIYWLSTSGRFWTVTKIPIEVKDELFGTTSITWKEQFNLGLEYAGTAASILLVSGIILWKSGTKVQS